MKNKWGSKPGCLDNRLDELQELLFRRTGDDGDEEYNSAIRSEQWAQYAQDGPKGNLHRNCTESGNSVQFHPIPAEAKLHKFNAFADTLSSIPSRAFINFLRLLLFLGIFSTPPYPQGGQPY